MADAITEPLYKVPTHLKARASFGVIPERTFYVGLAAIALALIPSYLAYQHVAYGFASPQEAMEAGGASALLVGLIPIAILAPFALFLVDPPIEHGLVCLLMFMLRPKRVAHKLDGVSFSKGVIHTPGGVVGVFALATTNLDLASVVGRRSHHNKLGYLFDGISKHPFQIVIRSKAQARYGCIERMQRSSRPAAQRLARWLVQHYEQRGAIDRQRFMMIPAETEEMLTDRMDLIGRSLKKHGVDRVRLTDPDDLRDFLNDWWQSTENITIGARGLETDSEHVSIYAVSGLPSMIATNWWQPLVDGDVPIDVVMTCQQRDLRLAKDDLSRHYNNLASSPWAIDREIGMAQIRDLQYAFEGRVRPWDVQILLVVRGPDAATRDLRARRMVQMMDDLGGKLDLLMWEQHRAMASAQPLCGPMLVYHSMYLESRTLVRTTPLSASSLQMLDGVLWGDSGSVPILLTTTHMRTGKHFGWYGFTGSGKGYGLRAYLARRVFADKLRVFMWDTDRARHEYSGRFTEYLEGRRYTLKTIDEVRALTLDPRDTVVAFDVSELDEKFFSEAFALIKKLVEDLILAHPMPTALVIDEVMQLVDHPDKRGARAMASAVTMWRKYGCEVHVVTQRVSDWFDSKIGQRVQGSLAVCWFGQQKDTEITAIGNRVHWTPEEMERISSAGTGEALLIAFGRRVWSDLFEQCSPEEHDAYETDPPEERLELLAYSEESDGDEPVNGTVDSIHELVRV